MNKVNSFVKQFCAVVTGDSSKATAEKVKRSADSALNMQIALKNGDTIRLEDNVSDAKEALKNARVNNGKEMKSENDRLQYVSNLIASRNAVVEAEEALEDHKELLKFLNTELKALDAVENEE